MIRADRLKRTGLLLALAAALGLGVALGDRLIFAAALNRSVDLDEVDAVAMNAVLTAIPFVYLAFRPRRSLWLVALLATVAVQGWWLADGIAYQMAGRGGGVPIVGAVLVLVSPFATLLVVGVLDLLMPRRAKGA